MNQTVKTRRLFHTASDARVYLSITDGQVTTQRTAEVTGLGRRTVQRAAVRLERAGFVQRDEFHEQTGRVTTWLALGTGDEIRARRREARSMLQVAAKT